jgi:Apea-like HEPN
MIAAGTDLKSRLLKPEIDREVFCEVLLNHYQCSNGSAAELSFGNQDSPSITVKWSSKGEVKSVIADALRATETQYRRFPLFSHRPVSGAIGFEGWFQIVPAPATAPQPTSGWGDYVSVLEVCVQGSTLPILVGQRAYRQAREIELLLSALTVAGFRMPTRNSEPVWVRDPADQWNLKHLQRAYSHADVSGAIPNFSDISAMENIELGSLNGYFDGRSQGASDNAILPGSFPILAFKFNALSKKEKSRFLRAAHWIMHADEVWRISRSAAYVAAVSAIESLLPPPPTVEAPCSLCGNKKNEGLTQRFAKFVDSMAGGEIPRKQRLEFYQRRSRLVHGQLIARSDDFDHLSTDPMRLRENSDQKRLMAISRIVLHNWLIEKT